jgi:uncharacterized protein
MKLSNYVKIYPYEEKPDYLLCFSTKRAATVLLKKSIIDSIEQGTLSETDYQTLANLDILVDDLNQEKNTMLCLLDEANDNNTHFNAIVVLNLDCNLSCRYCYEGTLKGAHYMSREKADLFVDYVISLLSSGNKKSLNFDFYGGEPLLSLELIKYISKRVMEFTKDNSIEYTFTLVTNGTLLTRRVAEELSSLGLKGARTTIDGMRENHNVYRPYKSGGGSFDKIIQNIKETCGTIGIGLGGNFDRENYHNFPMLLEHLVDEGLTPEKITNIHFDPIAKTHNELAPSDFKDIGCESINEPWLIEAGFLLREEILKRGYNTQKIRPSPCMIDIRDEIVINYDGTMYKCPGLIGTKGFEVGDIKTGIEDYSDSHNLNNWKNEECLGCEYLPICFGGCRYMKYLSDGDIHGNDCKKPYYDATLETFIKQDLKYGLKAK